MPELLFRLPPIVETSTIPETVVKKNSNFNIILKIVHQMQTILRKDKSKIIQKCEFQFQHDCNKNVSSEPLFQKNINL